MGGRRLEQKLIHIPTGETVVVCTGVVLVDEHSLFNQAHRSSWKFLEPLEGGKKESSLVKRASNQLSINELGKLIESLGYELPESYGIIVNTDTTNITVKKKRIALRLAFSQNNYKNFSFQYRADSITSYHDAMHNALDLRELLYSVREERNRLNKQVSEAREILKIVKNHKG